MNGKANGSISGFRVGTDGSLTPLAGSTRVISGSPNPGPGSIRISNDGRFIVVTEKPANLLDIFPVGGDGLPGTQLIASSPGMTPFGADFDPAGHYILSEAHVGPNRAAVPNGSTASSLRLDASGAPAVLTASQPTTETAACWVQITPDGHYAYTTNTGSGTITGFAISGDGTLTRLTADGMTGVTGQGTQPLDMAYANGYLYALTPGDGGIHVFQVGSDGSLTAATRITNQLPVSATGLAAF